VIEQIITYAQQSLQVRHI